MIKILFVCPYFFFLQYEIDVDWEKIYNVFKKFLDILLIWHYNQ